MKKLSITIIGIFIGGSVLTSAYAQKKGANEISIGYGIGSYHTLVNIFGDLVESIATLSKVSYKDEKSTGIISLGYKHAFTEKLLVGGVLAYEKITDNVYSGENQEGKRENSYYTIAVESDYRYISNELFKMYSGIGAGYSFNSQKIKLSSKTASTETDKLYRNFSFHVNVLGIRVGRSVSAFAELGFGYKGIVNFGITYRF